MAATARAMVHSTSDQSGANCVGHASSLARPSVILRSVASKAGSCGISRAKVTILPPPLTSGGGSARRGPKLQFLAQQIPPAPIEHAARPPIGLAAHRPIDRLKRYLVVHEISYGTIEVGCVGALKHHFQVIALLPMRLLAQLRLDQIVEFGAGQGIRDADADLVRPSGVEQVARRKDILELFIHIAQLNEESDANTHGPEPIARDPDLGYRGALVHRIQHPLAAALGADPCFPASGIAQRLGHAFADQVRARLYGERNSSVRSLHVRGELRDPVDSKPENIVCEPDMVRIEGPLEMGHLFSNLVRASLQILIAPNGFRAPGTAERASPRSGHVQAEVSVCLQPYGAVTIHVDELPRCDSDVGDDRHTSRSAR